MSTTLAARTCTRGIAGETVRMIQASHTIATDVIERTYASLRPTIYRPSGATVKRADKSAGTPAGSVGAPAPARMRSSDVVLTVHRT
jgi:hypothetical protein